MNQSSEFNILGCTVRIKTDEDSNNQAMAAIDLLNKEVDDLRASNPTLKPIDLAVLSALKLATKSMDIEAEYKENVFALKASIEEALNFVEEVSPGSMQANP